MPEVALDPHVFGPNQRCFGCSPTHPHGLHLAFARDGEQIVTRFVPHGDQQGPPGIMHGGLVTAVADELAAWTIIGLKERLGFTAKLAARLRRPLRIGQEVEGRGRIVKDGGRVVEIAVTLAQGGEEAFQGDFTFALLDQSGAERLLGTLPEEWKRFCR
jgi:acyl-coenzyme A thioesterase PaaI-like protein